MYIAFGSICNRQFLAKSPVDTLSNAFVPSFQPTFVAFFLHSLAMWLSVNSFPQHNLHLLLYCVLSIFALTWLVLVALFWAVISIDAVSLFSFHFPNHRHVFLCTISQVRRLKCLYSSFSFHFLLVFVVYLFIHKMLVFLLASVINLCLWFLFCPQVLIWMH